MTPVPRLRTIILLVSVLLPRHDSSVSNRKSVTSMNDAQVQVVWSASAPAYDDRRTVYFMYDSVAGLTDIDFHPVLERDWTAMKSPSPDAVARLKLAPNSVVGKVAEVIRRISEKGGYKTI